MKATHSVQAGSHQEPHRVQLGRFGVSPPPYHLRLREVGEAGEVGDAGEVGEVGEV